ncbi:MAG: hypothetical protein LYZ66_03525 [Nitrososphaerales archaeon]|nr:hypothetical protein [Nitrososphaerales archaeon]
MTATWLPPNRIDGTDPAWPEPRLVALSYLVGVLLKGDGTVYITNELRPLARRSKRYLVYKVELKNKSLGFLKAFNLACSEVLARRPVQLEGPNADGHHTIRYCSKDFVLWWRKQSLETLGGFIETFPIQYLRGRFDSDGNVRKYGSSLIGIEPHRRLMEFERTLCKKLGIRTGQIRCRGSLGDVAFIGSKRVVSRQQAIRFSVNTADLREHLRFLNVEWRNLALRDASRIRKWTPWSANVRNEAIRLATEMRLDATTIRSRLQEDLGVDVPHGTLYSWLQGRTQSWEGYARRFDT